MSSGPIFLWQLIFQPHTEPVSTQPETVTESRWHQPWSEPVRQKINGVLAIALMASGAFTPPFVEQTNNNEAKWHQAWSEPVKVRKAQQPYLLADPLSVFQPRDIIWNDPIEWPRPPVPRSTAYSAQSFVWSGFTPTTTFIASGTWGNWPDFAPRAKPPLNFDALALVQPAPQVFYPPGNWPDFAPKARPIPIHQPWSFVAPPETTIPIGIWGNWPDFAPKAKPPLNFDAQALVQLAPQVWFPPGNWPDTAPAAKRTVQFPDLGWAPQNIAQAAVVTFYSWTNWPDFAPRAKSPLNFDALALVQPAPQVFYPPGNWPDSVPAAKRTAHFQDLIWSPQTILQYQSWTNWPDFAPRAKAVVQFPELAWTGQTIVQPAVVTFYSWTNWPDFAPRAKAPLNFDPLALVQTTPQVFYPPGNWPDRAPAAKRTVEFPALIWAPQTISTAPSWNQVQWPDLVPTKPRPPVNHLAWSFIPSPIQVWFPPDRWPDRAPRKQEALNYVPLTLTQTVRTPWNVLSTWPDFVPIRGRIGIHASQQQAVARFPGTIAFSLVTGIMAATEVNTDVALFAINVVPFTNNLPPSTLAAATAIVSIQEIAPS